MARPQVYSTILNTRVNPVLLGEIDRIQDKYSGPKKSISKADIIRTALELGLALVDKELKNETFGH